MEKAGEADGPPSAVDDPDDQDHDALRREVEDLRRANRDLQAFTRSVSHDLGAPLRALDGYAHLLDAHYGKDLPAGGQELLHQVQASVRRMSALVDALLAFTAAGRQPVARKRVAMRELARQAADEALGSPLAADRPGLRVDVAPDLPQCQGDAVLLRQVLANLLTNAVKFTRGRDAARIRVTGRRGDGYSEYVVADNGVGFDPAQATRLFEPFTSAHSRGDFPGTGLGLSIARRIVERHGGTIGATAEPGLGATFTFTVPDAAPRNDGASAANRPARRPARARAVAT